MAGFPPAKGNSSSTKEPNGYPKQQDSTATSTGNGGIAASLKIKASGTKNIPGFDKNVDQF